MSDTLAFTSRPTVSPGALRAAMGHFATGVTVVTSRDDGGGPVGTTANAVASLSLDPPLLLVCFARDSLTLGAIRNHGAFAVNVLAAHDGELSIAFAQRGAADAWDGLEHAAGHTASPRIAGALACLDCTLERMLPGGDHVIVTGRVLDVETSAQDRAPLLFYRGAYTSLPPDPAPAPSTAAACDLPTPHGPLRAIAQASAGGATTLALVHGDVAAHARPRVSVHTACLAGDTLGSLLCTCRSRLDLALERIVAEGAGVLLYTKRSGGSPLDCPRDAPADPDVVAGLVRTLGVRALRLDATDAALAPALRALGLEVGAAAT
jgi:flavin reductase (DIM6/NTAB) family NADH-FMN oxidoreductase RutF